MDLPNPIFRAGRGIIGFPRPFRDAARDEAFMKAVEPAFPNVLLRQMLPAEAPPDVAHLLFASSSSRLSLSAAQVEMAVQFFGEFETDGVRALGYLKTKMDAVLAAVLSAGGAPSTVGLVLTLHFSFANEPIGAESAQIVDKHLRGNFDPDSVQEASVRVAFRLADTYFVSFAVANYYGARQI